jgi:nicotinamidase-related amidase
MSSSSNNRPALLLIDIQKGFSDIIYWGGGRNNPGAETRAAELLKLWREKKLPVFHIKHCSTTPVSPLRPTHPGNQFMDVVAPLPGEPVIEKTVNSAFIGTDLKDQLDRAGITTLVIVGLTTDHCISTTTRMAGNLGYKTYLIADATATFDKKGFDGKVYAADLIHETALASLNEEFATVVTTDAIKEML